MGAIAIQARVNSYLGIDGLGLLVRGLPPVEVVRRLIEGDLGLRLAASSAWSTARAVPPPRLAKTVRSLEAKMSPTP